MSGKLLLTSSALAMMVSANAHAEIFKVIAPIATETTVSGADGETISNPAGNTILVDGAPAVDIENNDVTLNNDGTLSTTGITQTVEVSDGTTGAVINNNETGVITADSRAVQIDGDDATLVNNGSITGTGDQRNGTVYTNITADNFTLDNNGSIDAGVGNNGAGFSAELAAEGTTINIVNNGFIAGRGQAGAGAATAGDGLRFERTRVNGMLDGSTTGLLTGNIQNNGTIQSDSMQGTAAGVRFVNGVSFAGTLENNGTISGAQNGVYFGNPTPAGGGDFTGATLLNNGTISSASRALNIDGFGLTVVNNNAIVGTGNQRNGTVYADSTAQNFSIENNGSIDAGMGNEGAGFSAELSAEGNDFTIVNNGAIQGRGQAGAGAATAGDGIRFERERVNGMLDGTTTGLFTGSIVNNGLIDSESMQGTAAGIRFVNGVSFSGSIENNGTISGAQNGVYFGNATPAGGGDFTGGVLTNNGTISSGSRALNIDGMGLTVVNNGSILGTGNQRNGTVYADSTAQGFVLTNNGTIDAGEGLEGAGFSAELSAMGNDFTIDNNGSIIGRGNAGAGLATAGDGIRLERERVDGMLDATTTGLFTGTINNNEGATISSEGANGTVAGFRVVNGVSFQGLFNNAGTISGIQNGVYFGNPTPAGGGDHTGGVFNNLETGVITSDSRAFNIDGIGLTVNNAGQILGTANQRNGTVYADGTADDFTFNNSGTIDAGEGNEGSGFGAEIGGAADGANTFTLINSGTIQGRGQASAATNGAGDGVRIGNVGNIGIFDGTITNSGFIQSESLQGTTAGVRIVNGISFQGTLTNEEGGVISGAQNGLYFGNPVDGAGADHTGGVVNNAGIISSDSRALNIDGIGLTVNNLATGQIIGTGNQRNGTVYADGTADDFTFNNEGTIDAGEGNEGSGFGAEIGGAADGANTFTLFNTGNIQGRGQASAATNGAGDGVRIGNVGNVGLFDGSIINNGQINSESMQGTTAGIRFVNGISFSGTLENNGSIFGAQNGLYFGNAVEGGGGDFTGSLVTNNGNISSGSRALNIDGLGLTIVNNGSITGAGDQRNGTVYADSTAQSFSLTNNGLIDAGMGNQGAGFSAELSAMGNDFAIVNGGSIEGRGQAGAGSALAGDGLRFERERVDGMLDGTTTGLFTGSIVNNGAINSESMQGTAAGIRFVNGVSFSGTLENNGSIFGAQNGLYFGNATPAGGGDFTGSLVTNNGLISSGSRALNIDGTGLTIVNNGSIQGTGAQRNGTVYADGTANSFNLTNNGLIDAIVQGSGISLQLGVADGDMRDFNIVNNGTTAGRGEALASGASAGIRLFNGAGAGTTVTATGDITNNGLVTSETSAAVLIENVAFTGTFFNNGTLQGTSAVDASGALAAVNFVQSGGTLGADFIGSAFMDTFTFADATSELNGDFIGNVGVVVDTPATVLVNGMRAIDGNFTLNGTLNFDLPSDSLLVQGDTVLGADSIVNVNTAGIQQVQVGQTFVVLDETGSFTDNGVTVNVNESDFLIDYIVDIGSITITTAAADLSGLSADANISSFGGALTNAVTANQLPTDVFNALNGLSDAAGFEAAAIGLLPTINEGVTREIFETQNVFDSFVANRLASDETGIGLWGQALARVADRDAESTSISGYDADSLGFSIGADFIAGDVFRIGLAYSYAAIDIDGAELSEIDSSQITAYFGYNKDKTFINGLVGYSFNNVDAARSNLVGTTLSSYDVDGIRAQLNAGYDLGGEKIGFTPFVGLNYASLSTDDFTETGGLNLSVDAANVSFLEGRIGGRLATKGNDKFGANVSAAYAYDFIGDAREFDLAFAGSGGPFRVSTTDGEQSRFEFGAGVRFGDVNSFSVVLDYQGEVASSYNSHSGLIRLRYAF
jgi:uncharacterized protein with beta-barrel porin domain